MDQYVDSLSKTSIVINRWYTRHPKQKSQLNLFNWLLSVPKAGIEPALP